MHLMRRYMLRSELIFISAVTLKLFFVVDYSWAFILTPVTPASFKRFVQRRHDGPVFLEEPRSDLQHQVSEQRRILSPNRRGEKRRWNTAMFASRWGCFLYNNTMLPSSISADVFTNLKIVSRILYTSRDLYSDQGIERHRPVRTVLHLKTIWRAPILTFLDLEPSKQNHFSWTTSSTVASILVAYWMMNYDQTSPVSKFVYPRSEVFWKRRTRGRWNA